MLEKENLFEVLLTFAGVCSHCSLSVYFKETLSEPGKPFPHPQALPLRPLSSCLFLSLSLSLSFPPFPQCAVGGCGAEDVWPPTIRRGHAHIVHLSVRRSLFL